MMPDYTNVYDLGESVLITALAEEDNAPVNPDVVIARIRKPDGTEVTTEPLFPQELGEFSYEIESLDQVGTWYYRFEGTGAHSGARERFFNVRPSRFAS